MPIWPDNRIRKSLTLSLSLILFLLNPYVPAQDEFRDVGHIVAIGDVHGDFDTLVTILRDAKLVDRKNRWIGGKTHLVQTGDILDRGSQSRKVMDLLIDLEKQAQKSGGRVHALIGNHEAMNIYGDLRYVSAGEYAAFETRQSGQVREAFFETNLRELKEQGRAPGDLRAFKSKWEAEHPLGWVEHRFAFGPDGKYGRWLRGKDAVIKINDVLFLHGGVSPKYLPLSIAEINRRVREELTDFSRLQGGLVTDPQGPLWYRDLASGSEEELANHVDGVLKHFEVKRVVVGHTPTGSAVFPRFGGKVLLIDVGLSKLYGGPPACLLIENGQFRALHRGKAIPLPALDADILPYLKATEALDPPPSPLTPIIQAGGKLTLSNE